MGVQMSESNIVHVGPTEDQYRRAHPDVDWDTHEVLYSVIRTPRNGPMVVEIKSHHVKTNMEDLYAMLDQADGLPEGTHADRARREKAIRGANRHDQ